MIDDTSTVSDAKKFLRQNWEKGADCPCCTQLVKLYKRKLTSGMADALIRLYRKTGGSTGKYIHITELGHLNGGEFAQLKRWYLIDEKPHTADEKRTSGMWRITDSGVRFVKYQIEVPAYAYTYNGETIKMSGEKTDIRKSLGQKFNYTELMGEIITSRPTQERLI